MSQNFQSDITDRVRELEKGYVEVKSSLSGLHAKMDFLVTAITDMKQKMDKTEDRVQGLDNWRSKVVGWAVGAGGTVGLFVSWLFNFLRLRGKH